MTEKDFQWRLEQLTRRWLESQRERERLQKHNEQLQLEIGQLRMHRIDLLTGINWYAQARWIEERGQVQTTTEKFNTVNWLPGFWARMDHGDLARRLINKYKGHVSENLINPKASDGLGPDSEGPGQPQDRKGP